ncbi:hypothetical protein [Methylobacterium platani]|uniref:DUF1640 domain-containing protein n=2 Tax=Methylobacterium platani TaxID=427683 RepID=A0A179SHF1_9HYPH|nr:hypothetical protein [Methylobacterium platani]KMO17387.1 hypothetical protein SQ03_12575 [Methylobacterium platani JCM 14648]OAS26410.1 hypothetical protein A5481_04935 [Methylobacterium platani]
MTAVAFDTLRFVRTLRDKAKMSPEQAEGLAEAVAEAIQGDLATKSDIKTLKSDIETLKITTRSDLREAELRLEAKIEATKSEIIKWMIGSIGFQAVVIVGAIVARSRVTH